MSWPGEPAVGYNPRTSATSPTCEGERMNPQWRTETVVALCRRMLDLRDFSAMPILADALQDAGCADEELLAQCQSPQLERVAAERVANLLFSEETSAAVEWLDSIGRHIVLYSHREEDAPGGGYAKAIQAGHEAITSGSIYFDMSGSNMFADDEESTREFFGNWSRVTGIAVPDEIRKTLYVGCAC